MRILVGHECSGRVRDAMLKRGHDAWSCDIKPTEQPGPHFQCDIFEAIDKVIWDLGIFFPDCTDLCVSGIHWNDRGRGHDRTDTALKHVEQLWDSPILRMAIENPVGILSTRSKLGGAFQYIQPYEFGEDASKKTGLWLKGLMPLRPTNYIPPRIVAKGAYAGAQRWANQTDSGQNKLPPSDTRAADRARTYQGIAAAMAEQWA